MGYTELRVDVARIDDQQAQVNISGYLNRAGSAALEECVEQQVKPGCRTIVLDFSQVSLANCGGVRKLQQLLERLGTHGIGVNLAGASPVMRVVLDMAGVPSV
jgi:anti-anti-sigma factor